MASKNMLLALALLLPLASSMKVDQESPQLTLASVTSPQLTLASVGAEASIVAGLEKHFARSEEAHHQSMDEISKGLTLPKAMQVLQQRTVVNASDLSALKRIEGIFASSGNLRSDGFGGLDGARRLLNDMIHESATKYDAEIEKCTDYYAKQCASMEVARGEIAASNEIAASSRALILDAQYNINKCQQLIPETKMQLKNHNNECATEDAKLNHHLKIVMDDIAVMTVILEMSDCDAKFVQVEKLSLLRCEDTCTNKEFVTFNHNGLQQNVDKLQSAKTRELLAETFADLFDDDNESADYVELVQVPGSEYMVPADQTQLLVVEPKVGGKDKHGCTPGSGETWCEMTKRCVKSSTGEKCPKGVVTKFNNPPTPKTKVPRNPCNDPNQGAPSAANKRAAKCTLKKSPRCYKIQGRFLQIQAEIADQRDKLMAEIEQLKDSCQETRNTLTTSIDNDQSLLDSSQTKLATATEKEATAGENGRQVSAENDQYDNDLKKQMKTCTTNYIDFETELCALKKIRGDLFKKMEKGHSGFFQDCELDKWTPEACSKKCAGGEQKLTRSVLTHPSGGAKCLPLSAQKKCNRGPCPVDCQLQAWGGWSKCSSKCGGGLTNRVRDIKRASKYGGKPCGEKSESKQCNVEACEKDCVLKQWTRWTSCSKDCDGGTRMRTKFIKEAAEGSGKCADKWAKTRLEYKECNMQSCLVRSPKEALECNKTLDIVLLMDGTPKSGKDGWAAEVKAANLFINAFSNKAHFSVIHYTGPRTWSGVSKCTGKSSKKVDMEKTCRVKIAQHFTEKKATVKSTIGGLQYAPGTKLLSLALMSTQAEFSLGRKDARTIVVVFIDGEPLSYRKTRIASRKLRMKARLVWVPVAKFLPLKNLKKWATRRWQENIVTVTSAKDWAKPETSTHIIANICPTDFQKVKVKKVVKEVELQ